eukprot:scaffold958_cov229-Ochromonas_danica.AAC.14
MAASEVGSALSAFVDYSEMNEVSGGQSLLQVCSARRPHGRPNLSHRDRAERSQDTREKRATGLSQGYRTAGQAAVGHEQRVGTASTVTVTAVTAVTAPSYLPLFSSTGARGMWWWAAPLVAMYPMRPKRHSSAALACLAASCFASAHTALLR